MQECIGSIRSWMATDKLKLNEAKTEIILIGTNRQREKVNIDRLNIGQVTVPTVNSAVCNIGSWFDANLSMTTQINKICQSGYYHLSNVRQTRRYLTDNSTKLLVQTVIMARVNYCISLLYRTLQNYNIYRTLQHSSSAMHRGITISHGFFTHCIGCRCGSELNKKLQLSPLQQSMEWLQSIYMIS